MPKDHETYRVKIPNDFVRLLKSMVHRKKMGIDAMLQEAVIEYCIKHGHDNLNEAEKEGSQQ